MTVYDRCESCCYLVEGDNGEWLCENCAYAENIKEIHDVPNDECALFDEPICVDRDEWLEMTALYKDIDFGYWETER